jgi:hypothetical protein
LPDPETPMITRTGCCAVFAIKVCLPSNKYDLNRGQHMAEVVLQQH